MAEPGDYETAMDEALASLGDMPPVMTTVDIEIADKALVVEKVRERQVAWGDAWADVMRAIESPDDLPAGSG